MTPSMSRIPQSDSAAYRAAIYIHQHGPVSRATLFANVHFSERLCNCQNILRHAINAEWLAEQSDLIALTSISRVHFVELHAQAVEAAPPYIGQVATSHASSAYDRPPISKRNIPNSKGNRDDVPKFSVRDGVRCYSVGGGAT